jgi:hypothetical protein
MPTDLPVRSHSQERSDGLATTARRLLIFYESAGLAVLLLMSIEARAGMFGGLSDTESMLKAFGGSYLIDGIEPNWRSRRCSNRHLASPPCRAGVGAGQLNETLAL